MQNKCVYQSLPVIRSSLTAVIIMTLLRLVAAEIVMFEAYAYDWGGGRAGSGFKIPRKAAVKIVLRVRIGVKTLFILAVGS